MIRPLESDEIIAEAQKLKLDQEGIYPSILKVDEVINYIKRKLGSTFDVKKRTEKVLAIKRTGTPVLVLPEPDLPKAA